MMYKSFYQERGGGVITERFLIGSMGRGVSRAKAQKGELVELTSMVKLDTICSIVYHWYQHPMPEDTVTCSAGRRKTLTGKNCDKACETLVLVKSSSRGTNLTTVQL